MMHPSEARFDLLNMQLNAAVQHQNQLFFAQSQYPADSQLYAVFQQKIDTEQQHIDYLIEERNKLTTLIRARKIKETDNDVD